MCVSIVSIVYLLDDVLSALDAHVAHHIVNHCILGLLKNKTRVVVSEHQTLHYYATQILHVEHGRVAPGEAFMGSCESVNNPLLVEQSQSMFDLKEGIVELTSVDSVLVEEHKEEGYLSTDVLNTYWTATGGWIGLLVLCSVILMQVTRNLSDVWLAYWVSQNHTNTHATIAEPVPADATTFYLEVYAGIAILNSAITLIRSFLFAYAGIRAAKFIHNRMLNSVLFARFQFFDITPLGRILNRFSSDTYTIDDSLPFILNILLAQLVGLIGKRNKHTNDIYFI